MAKGPSYHLPFRRRREGKTDYKARRAMIISRVPRVVTRGSLKHMNVQIIQATLRGDEVLAAANSQELHTYGWKAACGNIPAAYLTGLLCGKRAVEKKVKSAVADIGLGQPSKGARVFASIKGVLDAGVDVPHKTDKLPPDERLKGHHIAEYAAVLASSADELHEKSFSKYLKAKLSPEKLEKHFTDTKKKIQSSRKMEKSEEKRKKPTKKSVREKKRRKGGKK
jgi:large subunit ribosomal protein L18